MMHRIVDGTDTSIVVETTREIALGRLYRINPSEGMLGIESGVIGITAIIQPDELQELMDADVVKDEYLAPVVRQIAADIEVYLQGYEGIEYDKLNDELHDQPWIVYEYENNKHQGIVEGLVLPLYEFISHTMHY